MPNRRRIGRQTSVPSTGMASSSERCAVSKGFASMHGSLPHGYRSAVVRRYFGTDGVRGVVGEDLTEDLVERLGLAFALWAEGKPALVGRDTRGSGRALETAL